MTDEDIATFLDDVAADMVSRAPEDVQEMGDLMAGARQMGMMPNATDPGKLRTQLADFGRAIEEGAAT